MAPALIHACRHHVSAFCIDEKLQEASAVQAHVGKKCHMTQQHMNVPRLVMEAVT